MVYGTLNFTLVVATAMAILSVPLALLFSWLWARPLGRRLSTLTQASRRFAAGEFSVRVRDQHRDEVGELGRQFDDMAGALEQNVGVLRDMVQRNAELAQQAEQAAIQAERVRLSRDLHDAIAQRLFSLSVSTATLPDLIRRDQQQGIEQARTIASMAEQTLLDLRALLLDLRPSNVLQRGLVEAIRSLCSEWQKSSHATTDCSLMLTGKHIPAPIEDVIYRVTQEALSNVARHANSSSVHVSLVEGQRQITLSITDDGTGFDPASVVSHGKFGLISMRERAQSIGGSIAIESDTARGTTLRMTLPREEIETFETSEAS
jgi:NarL family two-component system sensor histidine kinase LiaS